MQDKCLNDVQFN